MNAREIVALDYAHLRDGESANGELCPACKGGRLEEGTLSVTRKDGALLFICYRASCGFKGAIQSGSRSQGLATEPTKVRGFVGRNFIRDSAELSEESKSLLFSRYGIDTRLASRYVVGEIELSNSARARLCCPVLSFDGDCLGSVLRSVCGDTPKTLTHTEPNAMAWCRNFDTPDIIIVEDQFSAIRASVYMNAVALLGTHLSDDRAAEIKRYARGNVYLALDADAWAKAVGYAKKYRSYLGLRLIRLAKDIKDMSEEELQELLNDQT